MISLFYRTELDKYKQTGPPPEKTTTEETPRQRYLIPYMFIVKRVLWLNAGPYIKVSNLNGVISVSQKFVLRRILWINDSPYIEFQIRMVLNHLKINLSLELLFIEWSSSGVDPQQLHIFGLQVRI